MIRTYKGSADNSTPEFDEILARAYLAGTPGKYDKVTVKVTVCVCGGVGICTTYHRNGRRTRITACANHIGETEGIDTPADLAVNCARIADGILRMKGAR